MTAAEAVGAWLRDLRVEAGLRRIDVAFRIGVYSDRQLYRWEAGQNAPSGDTLLRLLVLYGVKFDPPIPPDVLAAVETA